MIEASIKSGVHYGALPSPMPATGEPEASHHKQVAAALRRAGVLFIHVPMGGARGRQSGAEARNMGAQKGFPDFLILDRLVIGRCPCCGMRCPAYILQHGSGVALELKRPVRGSKLSKEQARWLRQLSERGWHATVQWGAQAALDHLRGLGYEL